MLVPCEPPRWRRTNMQHIPKSPRRTYLIAAANEAAIERGVAWLAAHMRRCGKAGMLLADLSDAELDGFLLAAFANPAPGVIPRPVSPLHKFDFVPPGGGAVSAGPSATRFRS